MTTLNFLIGLKAVIMMASVVTMTALTFLIALKAVLKTA
jgi:hypothetical protein